MSCYVYVWAFRVKLELASEFERAYGPDGDWTRLFRRAEGHLKTELLRDQDKPGRFITIDTWRSRADYERFQADFAPEYAALDAACAALTIDEQLLGQFATIA